MAGLTRPAHALVQKGNVSVQSFWQSVARLRKAYSARVVLVGMAEAVRPKRAKSMMLMSCILRCSGGLLLRRVDAWMICLVVS